ncbi:V-set and transmembrane domain-containing protein 5 isoform X1 [Anolis carolinensis]|uniref:Uncharacterized protein n=1 Tax=Anolis carolinensis TaxID=28377 RepID=G1KPW1_ANOCA
MRPLACLQACRQGIPLGVMTFCLMAVWTFQAQGQEVSLRVSQPNVNTTVEKDILLSIAYTCESIPIIEWKHTSPRGTVKIAEWKPESYTNISRGFEDRVNVYENGSLQLLKVDLRDSGYYLVTVRDEFGITVYGTILLNVYGMKMIFCRMLKHFYSLWSGKLKSYIFGLQFAIIHSYNGHSFVQIMERTSLYSLHVQFLCWMQISAADSVDSHLDANRKQCSMRPEKAIIRSNHVGASLLSGLNWFTYTNPLSLPLYFVLERTPFYEFLGLPKIFYRDMIAMYKYVKESHREEGASLFSAALQTRTWNNGFKLQERRFHLNIRKNFLTVRAVWKWNSLPGLWWKLLLWRFFSRNWMVICQGCFECDFPAS